MFCPKCGTKNVDGAKFCCGCGAPLGTAPATVAAPGVPTAKPMTGMATDAKPKKKMPVIIGAVAAVIAMVLVAAFVVVPALYKNPFKGAKVGDTVQFGSYEQDGNTSNGKEAIDWRVLAVDGNRALVISDKALDAHAFNSDQSKGNDWDSSDLKAWLTGDFANAAFSDSDKKIINGEPTLLSVDEANQYFQSDDDRICWPTQQALNDGAWTWDQNGACTWWLRSPGAYSFSAAVVAGDGYVSSDGSYVDGSRGSVRPALWVNL